MADTPTPAPAGAESAPTRNPIDVLDMHWEGDPGPDTDPSEEEVSEEQDTSEPAEPEPTPEPEGEEEEAEPENEEGEGPEDDASEPEQKEEPAEDDETGTRMHRLRDGTAVSLADLKKGFDRAREFDRVLPQVQQEHQRFQQAQQQFAAQQQQFQTLAAHVAQIAQENFPPEPDRKLLDRNSVNYDPIAYFEAQDARKAAVDSFNLKFQGVAQAQYAASQQAQQEQAQRIQAVRQQAAQQFFAARPDLQPKEKAEEYFRDFHAVADAVGYSRDERAKVEDPRLYEMARLAAIGLKAVQADQQQKAATTQRKSIAAKKVANVPPVAPPAARQTAGARDRQSTSASLERLRKSHSPRDAEDFLSRFE